MHSLRKTIATAALLFAGALTSNAQQPVPGTVNYWEGHVVLDGKTVVADEAGPAVISQGQLLQTEQGRAELLLTPGVYVRVGQNSAIKMSVVSDKDVRVELVSGQALVEVDRTSINRRLDFIDQGADAHLDRTGIYRFDASQPAIAVYAGRVRVEDDRRGVTLGPGQELLLNSANGLKPQKFNRAETDAVYAWSVQRADYASQVSEWMGEGLLALDGGAKYNQGWYWNPWYKSWAFVPQKGYTRTPFGYGFYAPQTPHYMTPVFGDFRK